MKDKVRYYLSQDYLWTSTTGAKFEKYYLFASTFLLVIAVIYRIFIFIRGNRPEVLKSFDRYVFWGLLCNSILGLFICFSRMQSLPIFSYRAISWAWVIGTIAYFIFLIIYWYKKVPQKLSKFYENKRKSKYLTK